LFQYYVVVVIWLLWRIDGDEGCELLVVQYSKSRFVGCKLRGDLQIGFRLCCSKR